MITPSKSKVPNFDSPVKFDASIKDILEFLKEAEELSDYIGIKSEDETVQFGASSGEDKVGYVIKGGKYKSGRSLFSIDYLKTAMKSLDVFFSEVNMQMGTDNPIMMYAKNEDGIELTILLAPRIEHGDDDAGKSAKGGNDEDK